jgi:hypothetical protein
VSSLQQPLRDRTRRNPNPWPRRGVMVLAAIVLLAVGVALGMALRDDPEPGGTVTVVRTLEPAPQQSATTP